jgi:hypothetical protein
VLVSSKDLTFDELDLLITDTGKVTAWACLDSLLQQSSVKQAMRVIMVSGIRSMPSAGSKGTLEALVGMLIMLL